MCFSYLLCTHYTYEVTTVLYCSVSHPVVQVDNVPPPYSVAIMVCLLHDGPLKLFRRLSHYPSIFSMTAGFNTI